MTKPLISVVMSVYNESEDYLNKSIESVLNQSFSDFEFIIVIDNPKYNKAREVASAYAQKDKRIRVVLNDKNVGLAASLNKAFSVTKGEYIARMDADDISFPERLNKQFNFMKKHPDIAIMGSSIVYIDEAGKIIESKLNRSNYQFLKRFILHGGTPCFHPTWFFKRSLLDTVKGYRILPTSQDFDFLMRVFFLGIKVSNMEEPLLYRRIHLASVSEEKNVYQLKLTRYIVKAAKEGFIMNDEKFSSDIIRGVLKTPLILRLLHRLSLRMGIFSSRLKNNKRILGFLIYCISVLISPYRLYHGLQSLKRLLTITILETREMRSRSAV